MDLEIWAWNKMIVRMREQCVAILAGRTGLALGPMRGREIAHHLSESAKRGAELFYGKASCTACHAGANFTDEQYHNIGVGMDVPVPDPGRSKISNDDKDFGAFKTPTI